MENDGGKLSYGEAWRRNRRAWKIWWKLCPGVFLSRLAASAFKSISPYVTIWVSAQFINELAGERNVDRLFGWIIIQLVLMVVLGLLNGLLDRWSNYEYSNSSCMNDRIYMDKMFGLDYADIDRQYVFDIYVQIRQSENWSGWGLHRTISVFGDMAAAVVQIIGGLGLSLSLFAAQVPQSSRLVFLNHPVCVFAILALMLFIAVIAPVCSNQGNKFWSRYAPEARLGNRVFSFYGHMNSNRSRACDLRMYCQQENVCGVYLKRGNTFGLGSAIAKYSRGAMGMWLVLSQCISVILTGAVYLYVCLKAWGGAFGVGSVTQYVGAITNMFLGISALLGAMGTMRANGDFLKTSFEFLDIPNNMYQGSLTTEKRADRKYEVEFRDVSFKYPGSDQWALRHVNIRFRVGGRLAVVGMNGSGKTTFIKLLCRLYDPTEGQVLLNGIDIRKYRYDDYMDIFSVVFQDFKLLALPLGQNVAGSAEYDRSRVMECLKNAGFEDRLKEMPEGLDACLYKDIEDGVEISGGEAQKIAIARALYKDAPFIVLDEPTAALDPVAEAEIYRRFNDIVGDKTAIYISHRLSSCKFCDEIAVFHEGAVIQQGTHAELVADEKGKYFELWNAQAQYYTE